MFNDRDIAVLGSGALLTVLCLLLPLSLAGRTAVGFLVLVAAMLLALLRLGPDRVPPELWLLRRVRYRLAVRRFVNQQAPSGRPAGPGPDPSAHPLAEQQPRLQPLALAWGEMGIYPLLTVFLAVVAVYFTYWLWRGGAAGIAAWLAA